MTFEAMITVLMTLGMTLEEADESVDSYCTWYGGISPEFNDLKAIWKLHDNKYFLDYSSLRTRSLLNSINFAGDNAYYYCESCGIELFSEEVSVVVAGRFCANGEFAECPECGKENYIDRDYNP